jgi:hypothetical protein
MLQMKVLEMKKNEVNGFVKLIDYLAIFIYIQSGMTGVTQK